MRKSLVMLALFAAACDRDRPPAPTAEQADQLDEAEAMLNELEQSEPTDRHPRESGDPASN